MNKFFFLDLKSPKSLKTPPPSPADFIAKEQAANIQGKAVFHFYQNTQFVELAFRIIFTLVLQLQRVHSKLMVPGSSTLRSIHLHYVLSVLKYSTSLISQYNETIEIFIISNDFKK